MQVSPPPRQRRVDDDFGPDVLVDEPWLKAQRKFSGAETGSEPANPPFWKLSYTVTYCSVSGSGLAG